MKVSLFFVHSHDVSLDVTFIHEQLSAHVTAMLKDIKEKIQNINDRCLCYFFKGI